MFSGATTPRSESIGRRRLRRAKKEKAWNRSGSSRPTGTTSDALTYIRQSQRYSAAEVREREREQRPRARERQQDIHFHFFSPRGRNFEEGRRKTFFPSPFFCSLPLCLASPCAKASEKDAERGGLRPLLHPSPDHVVNCSIAKDFLAMATNKLFSSL